MNLGGKQNILKNRSKYSTCGLVRLNRPNFKNLNQRTESKRQPLRQNFPGHCSPRKLEHNWQRGLPIDKFGQKAFKSKGKYNIYMSTDNKLNNQYNNNLPYTRNQTLRK